MMLVDWHDFAVVRTIDFDDSEDVYALGKPVTKQMVVQMNKAAGAEGAPASLPLRTGSCLTPCACSCL